MLTPNIKTVRNDVWTLLRDAQDLLREVTSSTGVKAGDLRSRSMALLDSATQQAHDIQTIAMQRGKEMAQSTDQYVRENPWRAVAIATGLGLLGGMLLSRRA